MKKVLSCLIVFCLSIGCIGFSAHTVFADENSEIESVHIVTEDAYNFFVDGEDLKETALAGCTVEVIDGIAYVDAVPASVSVSVMLAEILIAYLIDGVLVYITGYDGAELTAKAINSLVNAWNTYQDMVIAYFEAYNAYLASFTRSNGSSCVRITTTTYACTVLLSD